MAKNTPDPVIALSADDKREQARKLMETRMIETKRLRDDDKLTFEKIGEKLGITSGKALFLYTCATVTPKEKIKWKTEDELTLVIVDARNKQNLSWGLISARSGVPETRVRKLFEDKTGVSSRGLSIGKGGRKPNATGVPTARQVKKSDTAAARKVESAAKKNSVKAKERAEAKKDAVKTDLAAGGKNIKAATPAAGRTRVRRRAAGASTK